MKNLKVFLLLLSFSNIVWANTGTVTESEYLSVSPAKHCYERKGGSEFQPTSPVQAAEYAEWQKVYRGGSGAGQDCKRKFDVAQVELERLNNQFVEIAKAPPDQCNFEKTNKELLEASRRAKEMAALCVANAEKALVQIESRNSRGWIPKQAQDPNQQPAVNQQLQSCQKLEDYNKAHTSVATFVSQLQAQGDKFASLYARAEKNAANGVATCNKNSKTPATAGNNSQNQGQGQGQSSAQNPPMSSQPQQFTPNPYSSGEEANPYGQQNPLAQQQPQQQPQNQGNDKDDDDDKEKSQPQQSPPPSSTPQTAQQQPPTTPTTDPTAELLAKIAERQEQAQADNDKDDDDDDDNNASNSSSSASSNRNGGRGIATAVANVVIDEPKYDEKSCPAGKWDFATKICLK